jgi:alkylated DNA nucleotide flippase Atl1
VPSIPIMPALMPVDLNLVTYRACSAVEAAEDQKVSDRRGHHDRTSANVPESPHQVCSRRYSLPRRLGSLDPFLSSQEPVASIHIVLDRTHEVVSEGGDGVVKALETTVRQLLEGTRQYQVPLYQRTYSWSTTQLGRLWDDLAKLAHDRQSQPGTTHFIGSVVLAPSPSTLPVGLQRYLVVDGQQRLTTLSLLLVAIRDHLADLGDDKKVERINDLYLTNRHEAGQPPKLMPTQADRSAYLACLERAPNAGGADPIGRAYGFFRSKLAAFDDPDDEFDVQRLEEALIVGLSVVLVEAQAGENVHRIFESLNNTGLRLTQADLIRNYLFMRLPTRSEAVYESVWLPLQSQLSAEQLEMLFWLDAVRHDESIKQTETFGRQQARLDRLTSEAEIEAELLRLAELGRLFALILDPSRETDAAVRGHLERLRAWGTTTTYPLILHLLGRRESGTVTSNEVAEALRFVESFLIRRILVGKATNNLNRILHGAVTDIGDKPNVVEALRGYLSTGRKFFATDAEVRNAVRAVPFYWNGKAVQRSLILRWIEESMGSKEPATMTGLTVEHVMPQTMTDQWRAELRAELSDGEDADEIAQSLVHTIGNLTLTGYNAELSNSPFSVKRPQYKSSSLRLNQEIADQARWTRAEILSRADCLTDRIVALWPAPNATALELAASGVWSALSQVLQAIPAGSWTTYGDVAAVIGTHPVPLGQRLANHPSPNAHRVLAAGGFVASNFRWIEPGRTDSGREALELEGVTFDEAGRADQAEHLMAEELAVLAQLSTDSTDQFDHTGLASSGGRSRFDEQLTSNQSPEIVKGLTVVLESWLHLGGTLDFGKGSAASCFLLIHPTERAAWPLTIYAGGKVEVVFQHMATRPPFDDVGLRHEFRERLNDIDGIDLRPSRIELRPGFSLSILADGTACDAVIDALAWFIAEVRSEKAISGVTWRS